MFTENFRLKISNLFLKCRIFFRKPRVFFSQCGDPFFRRRWNLCRFVFHNLPFLSLRFASLELPYSGLNSYNALVTQPALRSSQHLINAALYRTCSGLISIQSDELR